MAAQTDKPASTVDLGVKIVPRSSAESTNYFLYELGPGGTAEDRIAVHNYSKQAMKVRVYSSDGLSSADGGLLGPLFGATHSELGVWAQPTETELTLAPDEEKVVGVQLRLPQNLEVRDYIGFIFVQPVPEPQASAPAETGSIAIKVQTRFGVTMVARVPGPDREELTLSPPRKSIENGKLFLSFDAQNTGNRYLKPSGSWTLLNSNKQTVLSSPTDAWGYVLPGSKLSWQIPLSTGRPLPRGTYELQVQTRYGQAEQVRETRFPIELP